MSGLLLSFDTETFLIVPTCTAPPLVCVSWATPDGSAGIFKWDGDGLSDPRVDEAKARAYSWLTDQATHLAGHNVSYDLAVLAAEWPELMPSIWRALNEGRVHDTMIREKLRDIAFGEFRWRKQADGTSVHVNYSLLDLVRFRLGYDMAKGEDTWRMRYRELHGVPLAQWPMDATGYSIKDSTSTLAVFQSQEAERARVMAQTKGQNLPVLMYGDAHPDVSNGLDIFADEAAQVRAAFPIQLMTCWGMPLDGRKVNALEEAISTERQLLEDLLIEEGLVRLEYYKKTGSFKKATRNTAVAQAYMQKVCADLELELRMTSGGKKGKPQVCLNAEACEDTGDEVLQAYADYTALGNVLGKDIRAMRGAQLTINASTGQIECLPRIHAKFDSLVASGRTACGGAMIEGEKKLRGFNLQNLRVDGETRSCFVPPPGWVFCLIDLKAAELYAVAQLCIKLFGFSRLGEVLTSLEKNDPHITLVTNVVHKSYEEIAYYVEKKEPWAERARKVGKHSNYLFWGGGRERKFASLVQKLTNHVKPKRDDTGRVVKAGCSKVDGCVEGCGKILLTEAEAHANREGFLNTWPEAPMYLGLFEKLCKNGATVSVMQYLSGRIRGACRYSEGANTGFQGMIADLIKEALFHVSREMYDVECPRVPEHARDARGLPLLHGSRVVNLPHDEIISLVPRENAHDCAMRISEIVLEVGKRWTPDVPVTGDVYLSEFWSKRAKPVHGPDGRLIPWNG